MSNDMKTVTIPSKSKFRIWHIEAPGCIVNIHPYLMTDSGHPVTSVEISADNYADGDVYDMPDIEGRPKNVRIRVVKVQNDDKKTYMPEEDPIPSLYNILRMGGTVTLPFSSGQKITFSGKQGSDYFAVKNPDGSVRTVHLREAMVRTVWNELKKFDGKDPSAWYDEKINEIIRFTWDDRANEQWVEEVHVGVLVTTFTIRRKGQQHTLKYLNRLIMDVYNQREADDLDKDDVADLFGHIPQYEGK